MRKEGRNMRKTNRRIIIVLSGFLILFLLLILYMTYFQQVKAKELASSEYNQRNWIDENAVARGTIYDRDRKEVVVTKKDGEGNNYRYFNYGIAYGNLTGYSSRAYGTAGLEKSYGKTLLNINEKTPLSDLRDLVVSTDEGNDLILTTNSRLQEKAYTLLEGHKGSIVVMNPRTGEIYAMSSRPSFDPNYITENWDALVNDDNSPLINRGSQGQYVPGSVFKVVTSAAILNNKESLDSLEYNDETGKINIGGYTSSNVQGEILGQTDLTKALVRSSNVYFAYFSDLLGKDKLLETSQKFYIGKSFDFDLPLTAGIDGFNVAKDKAALGTASFGQGDTLVTPLHMAMSLAAIANDGVMVKPYLVASVLNPEGEEIRTTETEELSRVTNEENASEILSDLRETANNYKRMGLGGVSLFAKSGTAEIRNKESTHSWMVAGAPYENPKFVVSVILEDDNTSGQVTAGPIANEILREAIRVIGLE